MAHSSSIVGVLSSQSPFREDAHVPTTLCGVLWARWHLMAVQIGCAAKSADVMLHLHCIWPLQRLGWVSGVDGGGRVRTGRPAEMSFGLAELSLSPRWCLPTSSSRTPTTAQATFMESDGSAGSSLFWSKAALPTPECWVKDRWLRDRQRPRPPSRCTPAACCPRERRRLVWQPRL